MLELSEGFEVVQWFHAREAQSSVEADGFIWWRAQSVLLVSGPLRQIEEEPEAKPRKLNLLLKLAYNKLRSRDSRLFFRVKK